MHGHLFPVHGKLSKSGWLRRIAVAGILILLSSGSDRVSSLQYTSTPRQVVVSEAVLEDFTDIVTVSDLGFNDFSGNAGASNKDGMNYGQAALAFGSDNSPRLRFDWNFNISPDNEAFTGLFFSVFGLTDTQTTTDGTTIGKVSFPEHSLNLDQIDAPLIEPGGPRRFLSAGLSLTYQGAENLALRVELKDTRGGGRFIRIPVSASAEPQILNWDFRQNFRVIGIQDLDISRVKTLSLIIERKNQADNISNPDRGSFDLHRIWFVPDKPEAEPADDEELLDLLERRSCQYFLDWSSRKPESLGLPQDRSTFGDLLTVGGVGFALPAYVIAAERGWLPRQEAINRSLSVLRLLSNRNAFGPELKGRIGHRGWFYHFFGTDGKRKLNFDFPDTGPNEALNTVELSTIDTALALMGVLASQSYFTRNDPAEIEIRALSQSIYDAVDWGFMLEPSSRQFFLSWKPNEPHEGAPYEIPDANGQGAYSGTPADPFTLDYYTDEAFLVTLLAAGSIDRAVPAQTHCAWTRTRDEKGLIRTFPGALFTYQFLPAFLDPGKLFIAPCPNEKPVDWRENARKAILATIDHAQSLPRKFSTYGPNAWGLSAAEGPDGSYRAYGAPQAAVNPQPDEDGTVTYYGMLSASALGTDLRDRAIQALRAAWRRGHWHHRFALPDAFNDQISEAGLAGGSSLLRRQGPWAQRALFAIDQGPMLLHLENRRSGLIWNLLGQNPNIRRAINKLNLELNTQIFLEGENGNGDGQVMLRSEASNERTVLLKAGQTRNFSFQLSGSACLGAEFRYSNDNANTLPTETVEIRIDGTPLGQFTAEDTGDSGFGWNIFRWSSVLGKRNLAPGPHQLTLSVSGGDGFGIEIDVIRLTVESCTPVTSVSAATFLGPELAAESIASAFGQSLALGTQLAATRPLPTSLAGTEVRIRDSLGGERLAPLFFVSPTQINYQIPAGTAVGNALIRGINGGGLISEGAIQVVSVAPGIFTANASGRGVPAAFALRVKADGSRSDEPIARFDPAQNMIVPIPIDLGPETEQVFLILFGTGIRNHPGLSSVNATIGGVASPVLFAGSQGDFVGLDQVNLRLPRELLGLGQVEIALTVAGRPANIVSINIL